MAEIKKKGAPTKDTVGKIHDIYTNTDNGKSYILKFICNVATYHGKEVEYCWSLIVTDNGNNGDSNIGDTLLRLG